MSLLLVLAAAGMAVMLAAATPEPEAERTYEIVFDNAFGIVEGGDLRIGGVTAGQTSDMKLTSGQPYRTIVTAKVTEPGFASMRSDARCDVRQQSLIGEYFVDCDLGSRSAPELPDGGRVPVERTSSAVPLDLINNVMRRPYRERFRLIISELGTGLAGRPQELNEVIRRAHPALRETTETLAILRRQNRMLSNFFRDSDRIYQSLEPVKNQLARWSRESSETAGIQASRVGQLGRYWNRLPDFLAELEPTMDELGRTADAQIPTLRKLTVAAPDLESFLRDIRPFAAASRRSIPVLGRAAVSGRRAITESREEVRELRRVAGFAPRFGKPLRQFLESIDDRSRSTDNDPLAGRTAPPASDKAAYKPGRGFTGMETILNYIYYQTLAINPVDEFGHVLRIAGITGDRCAPYDPNPDAEKIANCKSWLGPYQPGITAPDFTKNGNAARAAKTSRSPVDRPERRTRQAGEPWAPPVRGQRDLSKPQTQPPSGIRQLLDGITEPAPRAPAAPELPRAGGMGPGDTTLLDYLLAP